MKLLYRENVFLKKLLIWIENKAKRRNHELAILSLLIKFGLD